MDTTTRTGSPLRQRMIEDMRMRKLEPRPRPSRQTLEKLEALAHVIVPVPAESYLPFNDRALARIGTRDPDDGPVLACALAADCSIWTEDTDFFGAGVATWTMASVELFFTESDEGQQDT